MIALARLCLLALILSLSAASTCPAAQPIWCWTRGSSDIDRPGDYGQQGQAAATNLPGARDGGAAWRDGAGRLWLFGGYGLDDSGLEGWLNDLWCFDPAAGAWSWRGGSAGVNREGRLGELGEASPANTPGAREQAAAWRDGGGRFWLFGGYGVDADGNEGWLNDLWRFDPATGAWAWVAGESLGGREGIYGTMGLASAEAAPGAREGSCTWIDASGRLWLFGGYGLDETAGEGWLNDLWRYDPSRGQWTWIKGGTIAGQSGSYGSQGVPAATNTPGGRQSACAWIDSSGRLWLFGGYGLDESGAIGELSDLWRFDPASQKWSWIKGARQADKPGKYGTLGKAGATCMPGGRDRAAALADGEGKFWLLGGYGCGESGEAGRLNDLWRFDPSSAEWTWVAGDPGSDRPGKTGTQGTGAPANTPGGREGAVLWRAEGGGLWLFGGNGVDGSGAWGELCDLWRYEPGPGQWTWVKGPTGQGVAGTYGRQGVALAGNTPGGRERAAAWSAAEGEYWLFGGEGFDSAGYQGLLNDLWRYDAATKRWTWVKGACSADQKGVYGKLGVAAGSSAPGARRAAAAWRAPSGTLWLFGGFGRDGSGQEGWLGDLWSFNPATKAWTWQKGASERDREGTYGTRNNALPDNAPGAREGAAAWRDAYGRLWLFGGYGFDDSGFKGWLNDLWLFDPSSGRWTWISGATTANQAGSYGDIGVAGAANVPGAREGAAAWRDAYGRLWLFGGQGCDGIKGMGLLNDLWRYEPGSGNWTWLGGSKACDHEGRYGGLGMADEGNAPGARMYGAAWLEQSGKLWLMGGQGLDEAGEEGLLGDLWRFDPATGCWAWMKGEPAANPLARHGQQGRAAPGNTPGGRRGGAAWSGPEGQPVLFGGYGLDGAGEGALSDLWTFTPPARADRAWFGAE